jgi:CheY-like chemotaxis protein
MDVQMPVMDGYAATRAIRVLPAGYQSRIPIIAMTANAFEEDRKAALDAGMDEHISKPINFDKMKYILSRFLKK